LIFTVIAQGRLRPPLLFYPANELDGLNFIEAALSIR